MEFGFDLPENVERCGRAVYGRFRLERPHIGPAIALSPSDSCIPLWTLEQGMPQKRKEVEKPEN